MDTVDAIVIGAGVVGLAVARELALAGREVIVAEAESTFGTGISARHSEVIHAGIYYPPGSLKAKLCVEGKALLYDYCERRRIPHKRLGKLIVAVERTERSRLEELAERAAANGVADLQWLTGAEARALEPELVCDSALLSPSTGILDSHALMQSLVADLEAAGGAVAYDNRVTSISRGPGVFEVAINGAPEPCLATPLVINAAGLEAADVLASIEGFPRSDVPKMYFCKGNYFTLSGKSPFSRLIYPMPAAGGLGTHVTLDLAGRARLGPDTEWLDAPCYDVSEDRAEAFRTAVARYFPKVRDRNLVPAYAGVRPKLAAPGETDRDFVISRQDENGGARLISLLGIESPGLTASLAIGTKVALLDD
ncbi:NAD(P)/FAD-dependent oxidoreductase [Thioalkalivibrio sp. XN8]|uniref:NAD(P)/FAD-dependent oxidoreductase n=1 Tax=Thioalkalivibrio sp. XN8 TaxID=2712863 RepID=UPI0013EACE9F|nr:NAD(P)/FAD-dependent oxidoreductase [Thioalkalivibrio sp. XN8]NGP53678.1 NAD(P)/FAD-dependent oxidoreductase [Thioalkalivibrio sp. XN8]